MSGAILKSTVAKLLPVFLSPPLAFLLFLAGGTLSAQADPYPFPFDPFMAGESFGCKHLLIPGAEALPHEPVIDSHLLPGWKEVPMKAGGNRTIESLVIKGSMVVHRKGKDGQPTGPALVLIPAGGLVYDATPYETHLPVGDRGVIFGHKAVLLKKKVVAETCRNFSVLAGRSFSVGDSVITYLMPGPRQGPAVLWRTLDGVSIRPHPLDEYPAGQVPAKTSTRIFGVYTHAGQLAEYAAFTAPMAVSETWKIDGKSREVAANSEWFPHFRMVPISCPIGHHIGLMVYNDAPILLDVGQTLTLYDGYLKIRVSSISSDGGAIVFTLNGRPYTGHHGIDSLVGKSRAMES
ncbi:MAG: hypothetical protein M0T83_10145, partial [Nitrospiraceae bacterium]|nr:hypothetical protein [Nitrospiraceae bacterium]